MTSLRDDSAGARVDALRGRWRADCALVAPGADPNLVAAVGVDLLRRWREPHRRYHDVTHLVEVLDAVDTLCARDHLPPEVRGVAAAAGWFHDAVYAVRSPGRNEADSAELARRELTRLGAFTSVTDAVVVLVLDTATHDPGPPARGAGAADAARDVVHDADLWVLAAPADRFDEYCRQVREEYAHVPVEQYAAARTEVLRPFLTRGHVYRTAHARNAWEPAARTNLARELTRLGA